MNHIRRAQQALKRYNSILFLCITLGVLSVFTGAILIIQNEQVQQARDAYSYSVGAPIESEICPGETVFVPLHFEVRRAPITLHVYTAIRNAQTDQIAAPDYSTVQDRPFDRPLTIDTTYPITTPNTLPSGEYRYVLVTTAGGSDPAGFSVPFTVVECNGKNQ